MHLPDQILADSALRVRVEAWNDEVFCSNVTYPREVFRWRNPIGLFAEFDFGLGDFASAVSIIAKHYGETEVCLTIDQSEDDERLNVLNLPWRFLASLDEVSALQKAVARWPASKRLIATAALTNQFRWVGSSRLWGGFGERPHECVFAFSPHRPPPDLNGIRFLASSEEVIELIEMREPDKSLAAAEFANIQTAFK
ncbi:MAG: hypothetical protein ACOYM8_10715 [Caulobacterales bacterium]